MTSKEKSEAIRAAIKAAGYTSRQVSVKHRVSGYDDAWEITIKDATISKMEIEYLVMQYEVVRHEERTYEILAGCNDYIFVSRDYEIKVDSAAWADQVKKALLGLTGDNHGERIGESKYILSCTQNGKIVMLWGEKPDRIGKKITLQNGWLPGQWGLSPEWAVAGIAELIAENELDLAFARKNIK